MKEKKRRSAQVLKDLIKYIILCLEELTCTQDVSQFAEGEIIALVECLELVSDWTSFRKFGVDNIEQRFPIK